MLTLKMLMLGIRGMGVSRSSCIHSLMRMSLCSSSCSTIALSLSRRGFQTHNPKQPSLFSACRPTVITSRQHVGRDFFTSVQLNKHHERTCWKCGGDTNPHKELFFCECGVVQTPAKCATFFELLQIEHGFDVDTTVLSKQFKDTQRRLHPDKFTTKSQEEQQFAAEQSSLLNKSYSTLQKPLSRAIYLLELENITISENDSVSDSDFLMTMMEDFETIASASAPDDVVALEKSNGVRIEKCIAELSTAFSSRELSRAKDITIQLRYFTTIQERIKEFQMKFME